MAKKYVHIEFEDHGQDFLVWKIELLGNGLGKVIECTPFQGSIWENKYVINAERLKPGGFIIIAKNIDDDVLQIKYPLLQVGYAKMESEVSHG